MTGIHAYLVFQTEKGIPKESDVGLCVFQRSLQEYLTHEDNICEYQHNARNWFSYAR